MDHQGSPLEEHKGGGKKIGGGSGLKRETKKNVRQALARKLKRKREKPDQCRWKARMEDKEAPLGKKERKKNKNSGYYRGLLREQEPHEGLVGRKDAARVASVITRWGEEEGGSFRIVHAGGTKKGGG